MSKPSEVEIRLTDIITHQIFDLRKREGLQVFELDERSVTMGKKILLRMEKKFKFIDLEKYVFFRPLTNHKHMNFAIDKFFEEYDELQEIITFECDGKRHAKLIEGNGEIMLESEGDTELETKYRLLLSFFVNLDEYKQDLEDLKREVIESGKENTNRRPTESTKTGGRVVDKKK